MDNKPLIASSSPINRVSLKQKRPKLGNFILLLASILFSLFVGEIGTRILFPDRIILFPRNFTTAYYDGATLRRLIPNTTFWHTSVDGSWQFRTNNQGFRDNEDYQYAKPATRRRILALGDSNTQGYEVRQSATFAKVLERRLRATGLDAEVLNTGISGFGTAEELMFLEHEGMKYHPDAVVLAFFDNDFEDNVKSGLYQLENGQLIVRKTSYAPGAKAISAMNAVPGVFWLSQNSYLFSLLLNTVWDYAKQALTIITREELTTEYAIRVSSVVEHEKALSLALLQRMKAVTNAAQIPLIIVEIPYWAPPGWRPSIPKDMIDAISKTCDVFLPASSYLAGVPEGDVHVLHGHHHITELTHAKIAEALDHSLTVLGVIPGASY
jgi:GDSL-like Lipase/Acylhydrolase family